MERREVTYTVTVHKEPDDDGFWAEVHELPGCFASGASQEELEEALVEAIGMYLSDGQDRVEVRHVADGDPVQVTEKQYAVCV